MPNTNSWLCMYAVCQLGKPYWYATSGQISSLTLYQNTTKPALNRDKLSLYGGEINSQLNVKVHDCSGLVVGALTCTAVDVAPTLPSPVIHQAEGQFNVNCTKKSINMRDFPRIPGTLVFHYNGNIRNHVGIYVGTYIDIDGNKHDNAVVEAQGHKYGVTATLITDSKWDSWGQLDCCTIDTNTASVFDARETSIPDQIGGPVTIAAEKMTPFAATILPMYNPTLDYNKIKAARISMMMFFGGEYYDASHSKKKTYLNPNLSRLVQECNNAGMPYALYVNVWAKTLIEADEECKSLYYILSQFPPKLGIWLSLQFNNSIEKNNAILELYYRYIEKWGLKARCGLYVTPNQLKKITWGRFTDRFYLWMIDPMDVEKIDDELLDPEIFEVPD